MCEELEKVLRPQLAPRHQAGASVVHYGYAGEDTLIGDFKGIAFEVIFQTQDRVNKIWLSGGETIEEAYKGAQYRAKNFQRFHPLYCAKWLTNEQRHH